MKGLATHPGPLEQPLRPFFPWLQLKQAHDGVVLGQRALGKRWNGTKRNECKRGTNRWALGYV